MSTRVKIILSLVGAVVVAGVLIDVSGGSSGSGVSKYYTEGYNAGKSSSYASGGSDTVAGNTFCNQQAVLYGVNSPASVPVGEPLEDWDSGWAAGCEQAPYAQSGVDVPGSNLGPNNASDPYNPSQGNL